MTILNEAASKSSDGYSYVLYAICEFLLSNPRIEKNELALVFAQGVEDKYNTVLNTIDKWIELRLFDNNEGINFSKELMKKFPEPSRKDIPKLIREVLFDKRNNPIDKFWCSHSEDEVDNFSCDFSRGCAWILAQDTDSFKLTSFAGNIEDLSSSQLLNPGQYTIRNGTRWRPIISYMKLLGFIESGLGFEGRFLVDPTRAIVEELDSIFEKDTELDAETFIERLASRIPVLDQGYLRLEVEKNLNRSWEGPSARTLSKSLTKAFHKIVGKKLLKFNKRDDAPTYWTFNGYSNIPFTTVARVQ